MQEFQGTYDANMAPNLVYNHTKFNKNPLKVNGDIVNNVKGVWVLVQPLYSSLN